MIQSFRTDRSGQTVQTQIRLEQSDQALSDQGLFDQDLHCLQFHLHLLDILLYGKYSLFNFKVITANFSDVQIFRSFTVI